MCCPIRMFQRLFDGSMFQTSLSLPGVQRRALASLDTNSQVIIIILKLFVVQRTVLKRSLPRLVTAYPVSSVADPRCLSRIMIFVHPGSRI